MSWNQRREVIAPRGLFILGLLALCAWISVSGSIEVCEQIGHLVRWVVGL